MDICLIFGERVRYYRLVRSLSQEKLAELANPHRTYISSIERGTNSISLNKIQKRAKALDVQPLQLFTYGEGEYND